jgi:hypothetical protein
VASIPFHARQDSHSEPELGINRLAKGRRKSAFYFADADLWHPDTNSDTWSTMCVLEHAALGPENGAFFAVCEARADQISVNGTAVNIWQASNVLDSQSHLFLLK